MERCVRTPVSRPVLCIAILFLLSATGSARSAGLTPKQCLTRLGVNKGICIVLDTDAELPVELAKQSDLLVFFQSQNADLVAAVQREAHNAGLYGTRVFAEHGKPTRIHLADNLADGLIVPDADAQQTFKRDELLRVLHPGAKAILGEQTLVKQRPEGADDWSHPYHGPDNNPLSTDRQSKAPYLTQFLCDPWYIPMPQVTVASGGRLFKAFGHIALKEREWPWLNTLVAINGYNGTHLWKRKLTPGFMIHRNAMIATPETMLLADNKSCKLLNAATGELQHEIIIPKKVDADGVWKWMALDDGVLYALVGQKELIDTVIRGGRTVPGWPWSGLGKAYGGKYPWGYGRTLLAIDLDSKKILWSQQSQDPIDSRALCMSHGRIFLYSHQKFLACVEAETGKQLWKTSDAKVLAAIGQHGRAQTPRLGFASTAYAKANDKGIYFAGPQRANLAAVSAKDGSLMWSYPHGNFQLILRDDGLYAMGRMETSKKFDYLTGKVLADLECFRGNCTRATGTIDSIFTRGYRHTGTMRLDLSGNEPRRIPLMRPACQDGVIISEGSLYWGPWMCDCNHSLVGMISLAPAGNFDFAKEAIEDERLEVSEDEVLDAANPVLHTWPGYRRGPARRAATAVSVPDNVKQLWRFEPKTQVAATAPIAFHASRQDLACWSGLDGVVRAVNVATGKPVWTAFTGGAVRFPPEYHRGRVYVGSGDGWVYCFSAASGKQIWRFRAAPAERKISVHGTLLSNWPVGSGVLVHDGVVYAAAGITSYDGTHIYALDAKTGKIRWQNNTSGRLVAGNQVTGVSVQGHLLLHKDRLYLAGGNVVSPAVYDLKTGRCLNKLSNEWWKRPDGSKDRFPSQPKSEMFQRSPRGRELFVVDGQVRVFDQLLYSPPKYGASRYFGGHFLQAENNDVIIRGTTGRIIRVAPEKSPDGKPVAVWQNQDFADPLAMALCKNAVIVAGQQVAAADAKANGSYAVVALRLDNCKKIWQHSLPAAPVSWGLAVDPAGRAIVTIADGRVVALGKQQ